MLAGLLLNIPFAVKPRKPWDCVENYGPDCVKARTAKRKDVQKAIDTLLGTSFLLPFIADAVSIAEETPKAKDLMRDDMGLIIVMLAYYNWLRWKAKDKRDVEALLSLMLM